MARVIEIEEKISFGKSFALIKAPLRRLPTTVEKLKIRVANEDGVYLRALYQKKT